MSAWSPWDGRDRAPLRIGLATIVGVELVVECGQIAWQTGDPHFGSAPTWAQFPVWILLALACVGLLGVAVDRAAIVGGAWALGCGAAISAWQIAVVGSPSRNAFFPGAALLGWVLGQAWAWWLVAGRDDRGLRERLGEAGAIGCIAAAYVGSCTSKLWVSGLAWADGMQLRALVLRQAPLVDAAWIGAWRDAIVDRDEVAAAAAIATLAIEGGAWVLVLGACVRRVWSAALVGLHGAIAVLCTMPYLEPIALLAVLAVPIGRRGAAVEETTLPRMPGMVAVGLVALVVIAWLLAPLGWVDTA